MVQCWGIRAGAFLLSLLHFLTKRGKCEASYEVVFWQDSRGLDSSEITQMKIPHFGTYVKKVEVTWLQSTISTNKSADICGSGKL